MNGLNTAMNQVNKRKEKRSKFKVAMYRLNDLIDDLQSPRYTAPEKYDLKVEFLKSLGIEEKS